MLRVGPDDVAYLNGRATVVIRPRTDGSTVVDIEWTKTKSQVRITFKGEKKTVRCQIGNVGRLRLQKKKIIQQYLNFQRKDTNMFIEEIKNLAMKFEMGYSFVEALETNTKLLMAGGHVG